MILDLVLKVNLYIFVAINVTKVVLKITTNFCASIFQLQEQHRDKIVNSGTYSTTLTVNQRRAVAELVWDRW